MTLIYRFAHIRIIIVIKSCNEATNIENDYSGTELAI